jgi:hypothetical protein
MIGENDRNDFHLDANNTELLYLFKLLKTLVSISGPTFVIAVLANCRSDCQTMGSLNG